jgi:hypothetical protein
MTPEVAQVTTSPTLRDLMTKNLIQWRRYDVTSPILQPRSSSNPQGTNLASVVQAAGGPPVLVVQQEGVGQPLAVVRLPGTEAEVVALIRKYRGG